MPYFFILIVGVLAAICVPVYRDKQHQAEISVPLQAMIKSCLPTVAASYTAAQRGAPGAPMDASQCERQAREQSSHVGRVVISPDGAVSLYLRGFGSDDIDGKRVTVVPINSKGRAMTRAESGTELAGWRCGSEADGTNLKHRLLVGSCRGGTVKASQVGRAS